VVRCSEISSNTNERQLICKSSSLLLCVCVYGLGRRAEDAVRNILRYHKDFHRDLLDLSVSPDKEISILGSTMITFAATANGAHSSSASAFTSAPAVRRALVFA
jgi:hypothetical protein